MDYNFQQRMKKGKSGLPTLRHANSYKQPKKEDHFSYFETLQQKLLQQSDKLTNLIGNKSLSSIQTTHNKEYNSTPMKDNSSQICPSSISLNDFDQQCHKPNRGSLLLQDYIVNKKNMLISSKSQYFQNPKEKESQLQRKLTYNLIKSEEQSIPQESSSPSKSQKIQQQLKKTASTTGSSAVIMRTIDKIKRMNSMNTKPTKQTETYQGKKKSITINDFQIIKYLEEGQFGTVYLARNKATNFICALKKIPKNIFQGEIRFIGQLIRQIKIQTYLDHPNIVQLYSFFSDQENLYLILELCCGGNVYNNLRNEGRFPQQKVREITRQVSHAIEFMHDSDIIHRDIKPQNILFHEGIVKVCDFGWSVHSPLLRDTRCGTPLYSSPQVIQKKQYDNKIDVWNIGILTFQLLYGRVPFEIRAEEDLIKVVDEEIYFPKSIPITSGAKDFILKCLLKNPKERLPMAKLVDHQFIQTH